MTKITRDLKSEIVQIFHDCFTEDLFNKLSQKISTQLDQKIQALDGKLTKIDTLHNKFKELSVNLTKLDKLDDLTKQISEVSDCIKSLNNSVNSNQKEIVRLDKFCDKMQQYTKRNSLRFYGFEENIGEDPVETIALFITNNLKVPCAVQDIDCAFRIGTITNGESKSRAILVSFVNNWKRSQIFSCKKSLKTAETGISMFEDLTKQRYEILRAAKRKYGKNQAWSAGGKIYALCNGKKISLDSEESELLN